MELQNQPKTEIIRRTQVYDIISDLSDKLEKSTFPRGICIQMSFYKDDDTEVVVDLKCGNDSLHHRMMSESIGAFITKLTRFELHILGESLSFLIEEKISSESVRVFSEKIRNLGRDELFKVIENREECLQLFITPNIFSITGKAV